MSTKTNFVNVKSARPLSTISLLTNQLKYSSLNDPAMIHQHSNMMDNILHNQTQSSINYQNEPNTIKSLFTSPPLSQLSSSSSSNSSSSVFNSFRSQFELKDSPDQYGLETIEETQNSFGFSNSFGSTQSKLASKDVHFQSNWNQHYHSQHYYHHRQHPAQTTTHFQQIAQIGSNSLCSSQQSAIFELDDETNLTVSFGTLLILISYY